MGRMIDLHAHVIYPKAYIPYCLDIRCAHYTCTWTVEVLSVRRSFYSEAVQVMLTCQ